MKSSLPAVLALASTLTQVGSQAQQSLPGSVRPLNPTPSVLQTQSTAYATGNLLPAATLKLPIWQYEILSPRDGRTYRGSIVGGNPFKRGARTTTIPVVIIPIRIVVNGIPPPAPVTSVAFDPTSPDNGILGAGHTALSLTLESDQFVPTTHLINGVNMGIGTFADAFQRASFWPVVQQLSTSYHLAFTVTTAAKQTITVPYNTASATVYNLNAIGTSPSTNPISVDNPATYIGAVNFSTIDPLLRGFITTLGIKPNQFPLFLLYGAVATAGPANNPNNCCILGYHNGDPNPANPGQTYGIAAYNQDYAFAHNTATLSHEIVEWINDPSIQNLTPAWGNIGQVDGCQGNLETGDPLSGFEMSGILMPNGVTYYSQEQAFFSWFYGAPFKGVGDTYSSDGSFGGYAEDCPPGGTRF